MNHLSSLRPRLAALAAASLMAACGGGDDALVVGGAGGPGNAGPADPPVAGTDVPQSATSSASGAFAFVRSLIDTTSETSDPITVGDVSLGTSETDEPQAF